MIGRARGLVEAAGRPRAQPKHVTSTGNQPSRHSLTHYSITLAHVLPNTGAYGNDDAVSCRGLTRSCTCL
jgi:hypothetical protein